MMVTWLSHDLQVSCLPIYSDTRAGQREYVQRLWSKGGEFERVLPFPWIDWLAIARTCGCVCCVEKLGVVVIMEATPTSEWSTPWLRKCLSCRHFVATQHTFSMQLGSQRVWDYIGGILVDFLIFIHSFIHSLSLSLFSLSLTLAVSSMSNLSRLISWWAVLICGLLIVQSGYSNTTICYGH